MGFFRQSETIWPLGCQGLTVVPRRRLPSQDSRCIKNRVRDVWSTFVTIAVACDGAFLRVWSALSSSFIRLNPFAKNLFYRLSAISSRRLRGEWGWGLGWKMANNTPIFNSLSFSHYLTESLSCLCLY